MNKTPDILIKILQRKAEEVTERNLIHPLAELKKQTAETPVSRGFAQALQAKIQQGKAGVIAEIKKASPSKGVLRENFNPAAIAQSYEKSGAACLSVLTDKDFFQGNEAYLKQAHESCQLPILRKDFTIDPYQIYEAKILKADCILLIVAALNDQQLIDFLKLTHQLEMDALIEVHNATELQRALQLIPLHAEDRIPLLGINNRNLHTFETSLETTIKLLNQIHDPCIIVTESGIHNKQHVNLMLDHGISTFLVGEAFMRAEDPGACLEELFF